MKLITDIDWSTWTATEHASLLFVIQDGQILLIHKKTGLGEGKINGPGGRIELGETPGECAIREIQEELCITPSDIRYAGTLRFEFLDGLTMQGEVFTTTGFDGTPTETEEATPEWFALNSIPYDKMWTDDELWLPLMLKGELFDGRFTFDGDTMLAHEIEISG